jgi:hypothetical protein
MRYGESFLFGPVLVFPFLKIDTTLATKTSKNAAHASGTSPTVDQSIQFLGAKLRPKRCQN